ncbi:MAG: hypothetical protein GY880_17465 [Planctomycetaceae bacterium]|nr:hypothetical protein [Planctomycetaceae bacterium]
MNKTTSKLLTISACFSFVLFSGEETYSQNDLSIVKVATERPTMQPIRVGNVSSKSNFTYRQDDDLLKNLQKAEDEELTEALGGDDIADLFKAGQWPRKSIAAISLNVREKKGAPKGIAGELMATQKNVWSEFSPELKVFAWVAPDIRYQPLYFEDVALERYGQTSGERLESVRSTANFFTSALLLPYHMRRDAPGSCDYPLGFCRPGDVVPCTKQRQLFPR